MAATTISRSLARFSPPGFVEDLDETGKQHWSQYISDIFDEVAAGYPEANDGPRLQFFNPLNTNKAEDMTTKIISWVAFPKIVSTDYPGKQRFKVADSDRGFQDEYCEWSVERRADGKIAKVTFTCEGPEYWKFLGKKNPKRVTELYKAFVNPQVQEADLFVNGKYDPLNKWNNSTNNGVMHLIQRNNTLTAEIELAGGASIVREKDGVILTDTQELINCSQYGAPERNSDPQIGAEVNALARAKASISLADPIGLYIHEFNPIGWVTPDGTAAKNFWKIVRGTPEQSLRAVYEVPAEKNYCVGDIKISGNPIKYGSQITDFIRIKLTGVAQNIGKSEAKPTKGCKGEDRTPAAFVSKKVTRATKLGAKV